MEKINNFLYYAIVMGLFLFFSFYFHSYISFVLFFALLAFPFISMALNKYAAKKIELSIDIEEYYCYTQREYSLIITAKNRSFIPILSCTVSLALNNFYYPNNISRQICFSIPSFGTEKITLPVTFVLCGCYTAEITKAEVKDMLAFSKGKVKSSPSYQFNVFPTEENKTVTSVSNELSNDDNIESLKSPTGTQIDGIREYMQGDLLKNIHWKLSAKADQLLVKEFYDSTEDSIILLAELYKPALDSILTAAYTLSSQFIKYGHRVYLCWANSGDEQLIKFSVNSEERLNEGFSRIFLSYPSDINSVSLTALRREYDGKGIVYITGNKEDPKAVINIL